MRNAGWFKTGADPRRHALTRAERQKGYAHAMTILGHECAWKYAWLFRRVRSYYRARRRAEGQKRRKAS